MAELKTYRFHLTTLRPTYGFLGSLFIGLLLLIAVLVGFLLVDRGDSIYIVYSVACIFLAMLVGIGYSWWEWRKFHKKYQEPEEISFGRDVLHSKYFGEIRFDTISHYRVRQNLLLFNTTVSPSLDIFLKNGEQLRYQLKAKENNLELEEYLAFLSIFSTQFECYMQALDKKEEGATSSIADTQTQQTTSNKTSYVEAEKVIQKAKKRRNSKRILLPISFVFSVVFFFRLFGGKVVGYFKPNPLGDAIKQSQQRAEQYPILLRNAIAEEGGLYLYTNDTTATIRLVPYITNTPVEGLDLLNTLTADGHIMDFLIHKEDRDFLLQLEYANGTWEQILGAKSDNLNEEQSIYLLFSMFTNTYATSEYNLIPAASFTYKTIEELENQLEKKQFLFEQGNRKAETDVAFKWYVLAMENEGMTLEKFEEATLLLDKYFAQTEGVSSSFFLSVSNGNGDPIGTPAEEVTNPSIRDLKETIEIRQRIKEQADKNVD